MKKFITILLMALLCTALCVGAYAADEGFNASLTVEKGENYISVTVVDSTVLHDKTPKLLINCDDSFAGAKLLFDGEACELDYDTANGGVSFPVAKGGTYFIAKGLEPTSVTEPDCTTAGSAVYSFRGESFTEVLPAAGHDFSDTSKDTCANCSEPNPDYKAPSEPPVGPIIPSEPSEPSEPDKPSEPELCPGDDSCPAAKFEDVDPALWYHEALDFVLGEGIMNGIGDGKFGTDLSTTRAMIWTMLARLEGVDTSAGETWYEVGQKWAMENGISDGTGHGDSISREQLVTMLWRYMGEPESSHDLSDYSDAGRISIWAGEAMSWAVENGLIRGMDTTTLAPGGYATRAQVAQIIMNLFTK